MASAAPTIGQILGHYRIVEKIGEGGMGVVFRAHDEQLHRDVALKTLPNLALLSEPARRQFRREALNLARISDANVAMAFDFGRDSGIDYLVTELVPGLTLDAKVAGRPLPEPEVLTLGRQMASGLEAAHREGVVHRDLKPSNVKVTPEGKVKILDFGLAALIQAEAETAQTAPVTSSYSGAGTLPYMAPEQIKGLKLDARADVWSAGVILYELATGKHPFGDLSGPPLMLAIIERDPVAPRAVNPKISEGLERVILRAMQKYPQERYQSAGDLRIDLANLATGTMPVAYRPPGSQTWMWLAAAMVLLVLVAAGGTWWMRRKPTPTAATSQVMAVLPFESVANDAPTNALGMGLTETVTAKLVQATDGGHLQLVSTRDLVAHGIRTADEAQREFGTDLVLEGSLQQAGDRIRITCSLVDPRTHRQYAAEQVTGDAGDMFALQDQLFDKVLGMLERTTLRVAARSGTPMTAETKPAAYDFYLRGRGYMEEYQNLDNLKNAIAQFERAVAVDKNYAPAYAAMGMTYANGFKLKNQDKEWLDKANLNCQHALAITPQLAEGHTCLGNVYYSQGRYEEAVEQLRTSLDLDHTSDETLRLLAATYQKSGKPAAAEEAYRKAIALRPNYWGVYNDFGWFYFRQTRYQEAAEMFRKVIALAPLNYRGYSNLGGTWIYLGQYQGAIDNLQRAIALRPTGSAWGNLGAAYFYEHRYNDAANAFQEALKVDDKDWLNWASLGDALYQIAGRRNEAIDAYRKAIALAEKRVEVNPRDAATVAITANYYALLGEKKTATDKLEAALKIAADDADVLFNAALIYNHFGDDSRTLEYLRKAVDAGYSRRVVRDTPDFDHLRGNPSFAALLPRN